MNFFKSLLERIGFWVKEHNHFLIIALAGLVTAGLLAGHWWYLGLSGRPGSVKMITINSGEKRVEIAKRLESEGVIRSWRHFYILSLIHPGVILAGTFPLNPNNGLNQILQTVISDESREQSITIIEGWRREQIADYLEGRGVNKSAFLDRTKNSEGHLFPDTYFIGMTPSAEDVVAKMTDNFVVRTKDLHVTQQQLILASIIEREAKNDDQRPVIAGIFYNRLARGMPLEADPTVQYGRDMNSILNGMPPKEFWQPITKQDYTSVVSPYNTYISAKLPPGPICNPGLASITAAVHPAVSDAYYFFHTRSGELITSRSLEEHTRNMAKYLGQ